MNKNILPLCAFLLVGCATQRPLMDFTYVSTKIAQIPTTPPEKLGDVQSDWVCNGKDGLGLMETAVNQALDSIEGRATYIKNASFTEKGGCVMVAGEAFK